MQEPQKPVNPALLCWHVSPYAQWLRIECTDTAFILKETNRILQLLSLIPHLDAKLRKTIERRTIIPFAEVESFTDSDGILEIIMKDGTIHRFSLFNMAQEVILPPPIPAFQPAGK